MIDVLGTPRRDAKANPEACQDVVSRQLNDLTAAGPPSTASALYCTSAAAERS
jgi:hypothetical protein